VEGAFVRKHNGHYYCFYSGGAWKEPNYGVSYVVADHAMGPFASEVGAEGPEILRTNPERVIGPGHVSVIHAPDNVHEYIVYHAWDLEHTTRLMRIDRLTWGEEGPSSPGPTLDPQPAPTMPRFRDGFDGSDGTPPDPGRWRVDGGDWRHRDGELVQHDPGARPATALLAGGQPYEGYLLEANVRLVEAGHEHARYGIFLNHGPGDRTSLTLAADGSGMLCERERDTQKSNQLTSLRLVGSGFRSDSYHRLLVSARGGEVEVRVDGVRVAPGIEVPPGASSVGLITWGAAVAFDGASLTLQGGSR
jgi:glycosyl hydrolase family 43